MGNAQVGALVHPSLVLPFLVYSGTGSMCHIRRSELLKGRRIDSIHGIRDFSAIHSTCLRHLCAGFISLAHRHRIAAADRVRTQIWEIRSGTKRSPMDDAALDGWHVIPTEA